MSNIVLCRVSPIALSIEATYFRTPITPCDWGCRSNEGQRWSCLRITQTKRQTRTPRAKLTPGSQSLLHVLFSFIHGHLKGDTLPTSSPRLPSSGLIVRDLQQLQYEMHQPEQTGLRPRSVVSSPGRNITTTGEL